MITSEAARELRRIKSYSSQLFLPQEILQSNGFDIKVWNINEEVEEREERNSQEKHTPLIREEATFSKKSAAVQGSTTTTSSKVKNLSLLSSTSYSATAETKPVALHAAPSGSSNDESSRNNAYMHSVNRIRKGCHRRSTTHFDFDFR
jgi:hypothetical protein